MENKKENEVKEELIITKPKHQGLKIFIAVLLIIGLMVGAYFLYQYKFNNPKQIVTNVLEDARNNLKKNLVTDTQNEIHKFNGYLKINANILGDSNGIQEILKNIQLQFTGEIDPKNEVETLNISTKYKDSKLIDIKAYYENNSMYVLLDNIYDKYLKINSIMDEANLTISNIQELTVNSQDIQILTDGMINALKNAINDLEIKRKDTTITINGKDMNVIDNYIELENKDINAFIKNILNNLKQNKKFKETMEKLVGNDINTTFNELLKGIDKEAIEGNYTIHFYTDKNLFHKKLISVKQTITQSGVTISMNVDKISDNELIIKLSSLGMEYSIKIRNDDSTFNVVLSESVMGMNINAEININYEKIKEFHKPDISNNKDITSLTEKEQREISNKLEQNKALKTFIKDVENVLQPFITGLVPNAEV